MIIIIIYLISLITLSIEKELSLHLLINQSNKELSSFKVKLNFSKLKIDSLSNFYCNILDSHDKNLKYFLFPKNTFIPQNAYHDITTLLCFTNIKYFPEDENKIIGSNILSIELSNIISFDSGFLESIRLVGEDYDENEYDIPIIHLSHKYNENKHLNMRTIEKENYIIAETRYGYKLLLDRDDKIITNSIINYGMWQTNLARLLILIAKPSSNILHLGGHIGTYDILLSQLVGETGKILVFEPMPKTFQYISTNIKLNHMENIIIPIKKGAYSKKTQMQMEYVSDNIGGSYIKNEIDGTSNIIVDLIRIDENYKNFKADLVFMDIEGCEIHAYNGMKSIFKNQKKPIMIWEWAIHMLKEKSQHEGGDFVQVLDELFQENDIYISDERHDVVVKVDKNLLLNPNPLKSHFDILIIPFDHELSNHFKKLSVIILSGMSFSDMKPNVISIELSSLDIERCKSLVLKLKDRIGESEVICYVKESTACDWNYRFCQNPLYIDNKNEKNDL